MYYKAPDIETSIKLVKRSAKHDEAEKSIKQVYAF